MDRSFETGATYCFQRGAVADVSVADSAGEKVAMEDLNALNNHVGELLEWTWKTSSEKDREGAVEIFRGLVLKA